MMLSIDRWLSFDEAVLDRTRHATKIQRSAYLSEGAYPVIDQGQEEIAGYTDDGSSAYAGSLPVVLFGDHTRTLKFVDCPFAAGADGVKVLEPCSELDPKFLWYYLRSQPLPNDGYSRHFKHLRNLRVPVPPLVEQRRVVDLLTRAEDIVGMRREAQKKAKEIIPALFLDMFGDPGTNPKGWQLMTLGDVFAQKPNYGTMIPARAEQMPWLCLRVANIQGGTLTLADRKYVSLPEDAVERHEVRSGDILMARAIGSVDHLGKCVVAQVDGEKWAFDSHLMRMRLRADRADPVWLQALLSSEGGRRLFLEKTRRTAVQFNINTKEMAAIRVPVPPVDRQGAFAAWVAQGGCLESQQRSASMAAEGAFQSLLAGVFAEGMHQ